MDALYLPGPGGFLRYTSLPGRPPALVYLTGLGLAVWGTYDRCGVEPGLADRRAVLVDFLGAGLSDGPEDFAYSLEDHALTIAALLDHLGLAGSVMVGYSFGGAVAVTLAAARPDLVTALVLAEPNLDPGGGFFSRRIADQPEDHFLKAGFHELIADARSRARKGDRAWAVTAGMLQAAAPHGLHRSAVGLIMGTRPTMRERLRELSIPRAIIRGGASGPDRRQDEMRASGIAYHVVPGASHGMMWDEPDGFVAAVKAGLAGS